MDAGLKFKSKFKEKEKYMHIYDYDFQEPRQNNFNLKERPKAVRMYRDNAPVDDEDENQE